MDIKIKQIFEKFHNRHGELIKENNYYIATDAPINEKRIQSRNKLNEYRKQYGIYNSLINNLRTLNTEQRNIKKDLLENQNKIDAVEKRLTELAKEVELL